MAKRFKRDPIPIYRRDGSKYEGDEFDAMRDKFELQFDRHATMYVRLLAEEKRDLNEIVIAAMIQGMALAVTDQPSTNEPK